MYSFNKWLDRWVQEHQCEGGDGPDNDDGTGGVRVLNPGPVDGSGPAGGRSGGAARRFPDDPEDQDHPDDHDKVEDSYAFGLVAGEAPTQPPGSTPPGQATTQPGQATTPTHLTPDSQSHASTPPHDAIDSQPPDSTPPLHASRPPHDASDSQPPASAPRRAPARPYASPPAQGRFLDFARFWANHRPHRDLEDLSLASVRSLMGAREQHFSGMLTIRDDLPASRYLAIPFVRRCWRLLWILDEHEHGDYSGEPVLVTAGVDSRGECAGICFSWSLVRELDMNPECAQVNMRALLFLLLEAGFLQPRQDRFLSERARELVSAGSPGAFYKSLCIRTFNRCIWDRVDGLPPLVGIQMNALFLMFVLHARYVRDRSGTSPDMLADRLIALHRRLGAQENPIFWICERTVLLRAILSRFLRRTGRLLDLVEPVSALDSGVNDTGVADDREALLFRPSDFAERVLLWNP